MAGSPTKSARNSMLSRTSLQLSTGTVQCADPDLKREALCELFDHCMTPLTSPRTLCPSSSFVFERKHRIQQNRARPLSAAPALDLDLSQETLANNPIKLSSGLLSPLTPSPRHSDTYFDEFGNDSSGVDECGSFENTQIGTFADLRRKLYGGDTHEVAATE